MSYWWERYDTTPGDNDSAPPDGAPEDHFPDQVNNIQRQNMAAVAEIGDKVLGAGDGTNPPQAAVSISGPFLKLIYDALLPVNTIQAWDSKGGTEAFIVPNFPEFSTVDWQPCDASGGGGVPDLSLQVISGANSLAGPEQSFTGSQKAAEDMGMAGAQTLNASSDAVRLTLEQTPPHGHTFTGDLMDTHNHPGSSTPADVGQSGGGGNGSSSGNDRSTGSSVNVAPQSAGTPSGTVVNSGGEGPGFTQAAEHDHGVSVDDVDDHIHAAGQPASAALEYYIRVA